MSRNRREFTKDVKVAAFKRSGGHCEKCSAHLYVGKFHYDHVIPDAMGGEPTLKNCAVLCTNCHGEKTTQIDVPTIAYAKRVEATHIAARVKRQSFRGQSFRKAPPQRSASRPINRSRP